MNIGDGVYSVGAVDSDIRVFHGYQTPVGTTYNSYLIVDAAVTLIDFVKAPFAQTLLANIRAVIGDRQIDHLICNHVEPDHSGALPEVVRQYPSAVVYGAAACEKGLRAYYPGCEFPFVTVKKGDTLSSIARKYNVSIQNIKAWNNLKSDAIGIDQKLIIYPPKTSGR